MATADIIRREREEPASAAAPAGSDRLFWLVVYLAAVGFVMVTSASSGRDVTDQAFYVTMLRRLAWFAVGFLAFLLGAKIDYHVWRRHNLAILGFAFVLLLAVLVPGIGRTVNGARRWMRVTPYIGIQPSEIAKLCIIIWMAAFCERHRTRIRTFTWGWLAPMLVVGVAAMLVLAEPDFGTAALIGAVSVTMLVIAGSRLGFVFFSTLAVVPLVHKLILDSPYRADRILIFLNPWKDPQGKGYQLVQSFIAIGSGGTWGEGLGSGTQKLGFLPECSTDFVFSIISEEMGLIGAVALLLTYVWLLLEGTRAAVRARDLFGFMLASGITVLVGLQTFINIGVVTGCLPPKGLSLPLISAGGSSLLASMFALGVLVNVARSSEAPEGWRWTPWETDMPAYERTAGAWVARLGGHVSNRLK